MNIQTQDGFPINVSMMCWAISTEGGKLDIKVVCVARWHKIAGENMYTVISTDNIAYLTTQLYFDKSEVYSDLLNMILTQAGPILSKATSKSDMLERRAKILSDLAILTKRYQGIV